MDLIAPSWRLEASAITSNCRQALSAKQARLPPPASGVAGHDTLDDVSRLATPPQAPGGVLRSLALWLT